MCVVIQHIRNPKSERAVIHRVDVEFECTQSEYNTTGAPHNAVAIQSKCAKEGPAIFQHREHICISVLDNIL